MASVSSVKKLRRIQLGQQSVAVTAVATTTRWRGPAVGFEDAQAKVQPEENIGYSAMTTRQYTPLEVARLAMPETEATFEQILHLLQGGVKAATAVQDGAGSGRIRTYPLPHEEPNTLKLYSMQAGNNKGVEKSSYLFVVDFVLSGRKGEAWKMSANWRGRQVTPPVKVTADTIAFVSSTKKITDSGSALASFTTGMTIKVSGSTSNDGIYTIATGGVAGEIVTTEALVDESASATITVEEWFDGGPTGVAIPTVEEMLFKKTKWYIDNVGGTIGSTQIQNSVIEATYNITTGWKAQDTADGNLYFDFADFIGASATLNLKMLHNATTQAERELWRSNTPRQIRSLIQGSALGTAGTTYTYKTHITDMAGVYTGFAAPDEDDEGSNVYNVDFAAGYDATAALFVEFLNVCDLTSIP